ncbi:MAG: hypothetical protein HPY66_0541 [Firmicutes bacterium]|nr:hypothetical protein [Bacillota bacterium]MDI6704906.1 MarR family transcriptional regulator [Bacillota bacterium]
MYFNKPDSLYHVFSQVMRLHHHRAHMLLDKVGLYPGQPPMLLELYREGGQSQTDLAGKLNIKPATITVMLRRMEKMGLVERRQDPDDQRVSRVYLTERGQEVVEEVKGTLEILEAECFHNFTAEEQVLLRRLLLQMRDNLAKVCDKKAEWR